SLESLIEAAESILSDKYTADSVEKLEEAIENGKAVLADPEREEHAVKDSYEAVIDAVAGLQMKGSKAALKAMLAKANQVISNAGAYVAGTIEGLEAVTADAQAVYDEVDALQDEVDEAVRALTLKVAQARLLGDVDGDGTVTTADGAAVLRSAAELDRLSDEAAASADVNRDGAVDTDDAVKILQYTAEKIAAF
ncbi:MAG: dockerin type I repeat-containing protein, partial [Hominisplanchenecus sp.]|nr:dockerin type I repeat-containing protein [Hominisplanchenecus sp.]